MLGIMGVVVGFAADRLAARWPEHDGSIVRAVDWRTAVLVAWSGISFAAAATRWTDAAAVAVVTAYFTVLVVLLATDLDQRLLPDVLTLPLIPLTLLLLLSGGNPLLAGKEHGVASGLAAGVGAPVLLAVSNVVLRGGLGTGDLKLAVSLGLLSGVSRLLAGFFIASAASSVVLVALLLLRRLSLRTPIPYGPILIAAGMLAALLP